MKPTKLTSPKLLTRFDPILLTIALVAIITQGWGLLTSYRFTAAGLSFTLFHDPLWHLSLIHELAKTIPPTHPGMSGVPLVNYYYLSDLFLLLIHRLFSSLLGLSTFSWLRSSPLFL
jgi:hypothetical protein